MKKTFIWLLGFAVVLTGCATTGPHEDPLAAFHQTKPTSILVLPVVNNSVDVMASTSALTTLPKILGERGYYVFPVNTVKTLLEYEGFADPQEIHNQPVASLVNLFHADAVLYVTIHSWTSQYILISTTTEVDLEYVIKDSQGQVLFSDREVMRYTPHADNSGGSGGLLANLISSAIVAAVERASPNYLPLTREANANVFLFGHYALPPGPYHPSYLTYYSEVEKVVE